MEMYTHRSGYRYGETMATHQRRRFRLAPGQNTNPNVDSSLWIVHYSQADPAYHVPVDRIQDTQYARTTLGQRSYIQQQGQQLLRKDFMLHDRSSWPNVNFPGINAGTQASSYPGNVISHLNRQQPGYPTQPRPAATNQVVNGPPPAKRVRPNTSYAQGAVVAEIQPGSQPSPDSNREIYEAEDVSGGDLLDILTPRDISAMRYKQHHDWLGEVFRSPYDTQQIVPGDLGLGRKGELEALTKDFFNAPTDKSSRTANGAPLARVGRMDDGKAEEFTKMATDRIAEINSDIEKMKRQHTKRMAKLAKGGEIRDAERMLRAANINTLDARSNAGSASSPLDEGDSKVAAIKSKVEAVLGKEIRNIDNVHCVQRGGLQEKIDDSENVSQDYDFGDQAVDLSGQIPAFQTPQDQLSSMEHTPGLPTEPAATSNTATEAAKGNEGMEIADVAMSGMQDVPQAGEGEPEDWVVVNKEGDDTADAPNEELPDLDSFTDDAAMGSTANTPGENLRTTAENLPDFAAAAEGELGTEFVAHDFAEGVDFGHLDTAGEALSGYGAEETMGMDDNADLGLDDSAFGDAFHGNVPETEQGNDAAD